MSNFTPMSIGKEIRKARRELDLTQKDFAKQCGWTQKEQSDYEKDKYTPTKGRLEIIANKLGKEWRLK